MNEDLREEPNSLTAPPLWALPKQRLDPPRTEPGTLGHFFSGQFDHSAVMYGAENSKCPKTSGQPFGPHQKQGYRQLKLDKSSLNKCPKTAWQAFRPPKQMGNGQMEGASKLGSSQRKACL